MDIIAGSIVLLACMSLVLCCDINTCQRNASPFVPTEMCTGVTKHVDCLKTEFSKCQTDEARSKFMMMVPYSMQMQPPSMCGYDTDSVMDMLRSRTDLMMTMMNGTRGVHPMVLARDDGPFDDDGLFDDDGPFGDDNGSFDDDDGPFGDDDGPFGVDDGPFDDGPFDDGPFDDGPLDDAAENGLIHAVLAAQPNPARTQTTDKPPPAPGLLPRFRGGAAMHTSDTDDDPKGGVGKNRASLIFALLFIVTSLVLV